MSIAFEYLVCLIVALFSGTLLFTFGALCVVLLTAAEITWRWSRELAAIPGRRVARWADELHLP